MAINDATLETDIWDDVRSVLVTANLTTSLVAGSVTTTSSANITGAYPDKPTTKPQVVIYPVQYDEGEYKFGSTYGRRMLNVVVECYSDKSVLLDQLSQQVSAALRGTVLDGATLVGTSANYVFSAPGENRMHGKTLTFTYLRD